MPSSTRTDHRRIRAFGWRPQMADHRDRYFHLEEPVLTRVPPRGGIPATQLPPIWDQGQIGSCTAHGSLRAYLTEAFKQGLSVPMLSRLMQYWDTRSIEGTTSQDAGAAVRDAVKALATFGCAPEAEWPYDTARFAEQPPDAARQDARQHMAFKYQQVLVGGPGAPMRTALSRGLAIVFGFPVPTYFEDPSRWDPASGEPLPLPQPGDQFIGGHCVAATSYDFSGRDPHFTCDNSWGPGWGMGGRFNLAAEWFTPGRGLASDLWVIQAVK